MKLIFFRADKPPIIILGNKSDLEEKRQVNTKDGKDLADKIGALFAETSIKDLTSIENAFEILIKMVYIRKVEGSGKSKAKKKDKRKTLYKGHYSNDIKEAGTCGSKGWQC